MVEERNGKKKIVVVIIIYTERRGSHKKVSRLGGCTCNKSVGVQGLHLGADDDTLAAGGLLLVDVLVLGGAVRVVGVSAAVTSAVELDAVTRAGDAVAFAGAARAGTGDGAGTAGVGGAGGEGWDIRGIIGVVLGVIRVNVLLGEAAVELLESGLVVLGVDDLAGLAWALGLGSDDALWGEGSALSNGGS